MKTINRTPDFDPGKVYYAKFKGHRSFNQIVAECKRQKLDLDARNYIVHGSDCVTVRGGGCTVIYNTVNGRFFGDTPVGRKFSSDDKLDGVDWFDALLGFFYFTEVSSHG